MRKVYILKQNEQPSATLMQWAKRLSEAFQHEIEVIPYNPTLSYEQFAIRTEEADTSLVLIELTYRKKIQPLLNLCSGLRIPYIFVLPDTPFNVAKITMPITFLVEDKEKVPFVSVFGRFFGSEIIIYKPKDYGDNAQTTINQAKTLFDSLSLKYTVRQAKKGSFDVEREAASNATSDGSSLVVISASREYGLDDIIFGPKERKILKNTSVPIMLINPRADLYALCN